MSKLSNRLFEIRKKHGKSQKEIARILNKTQQSYGKYESGATEPDTMSLNILANFYGVSVDYLLGREEKKERGIQVPVLGSIPAGIPLEAIEEILGYEQIPKEWADNGEYFGLKVKGNSMEPRILNGDVVIVRKQEDAESGDVCVVMVNCYDATLKQIRKENNGIWLVPFNKTYSELFYTGDQIATLPVKIIGKVFELRGKF